ncbi:MAG: RidA family protein [Helicobacteraceae bacterium]
MQKISTQDAPKAIGAYSQGVIFRNLIFTSGQIALTPQMKMQDGGIEAQTTQVLQNIGAILKEAGAGFESVVKTTVFLTDMSNFEAFNKIYESFFGENKPARSTVGVSSLPKNAMVEIEAIAVKERA